MGTNDRTTPNRETRDHEANEARAEHDADREPTAEEAKKADEHVLDPETVEHEKEMAERGARQQGEGRLP